MPRVDWSKLQPYRCYFYSERDCPGWHTGQPCDPRCQRIQDLIPEEERLQHFEKDLEKDDPTPPVDVDETINKGQYIRAWEKRIYVGQEQEADTLPEKSGFRCVVMFERDRKWVGYLYRQDQ